MGSWLKRTRGALGTGLTWAAGWAVGGLMIGVSSILLPFLPWELFFDVFDAPLPALAIPGFLGGVIFSIVLGVAARRRRFDELSLPAFTAWGAVGGLLLSLVPAVFFGVGDSADLRLLQGTAIISLPFTLLGGASAALSLIIARRAEDSVAPPNEKGGDSRLSEGAAHSVSTRSTARAQCTPSSR